MIEVALDVRCDAVSRVITPGAVLLQALHHDPIEVAAHGVDEFLGRGKTAWGSFVRFGFCGPPQRLGRHQFSETGGGFGWFFVPDDAPHFVETSAGQLFAIKRGAARQQFIEQHPQAADVAARVHVHTAHLRLLGADIGRCADE